MKKSLIYIAAFSILLPNCSKKKINNLPLAKNYFEQSQIEAEAKNFTKALQLVNKSIEISSEPESLAHKATILFQLKQFSESLSLLEKIIRDKKISPTLKSDSINNYACTLLALDQIDEAREIWLSLTNDSHYLSPELAWFNLGLLELYQIKKIEFRDKELNKAKKYFYKAIEISQEYTDAHFYLALTFIYLKDYQKAKDILINLLSFCPEHEPAKKLLEKIDSK